MQKIGKELHNVTLGFATRTHPGNILDMCAAQGGFLATAIELNPDSGVIAFSLPPSDGGYNILLNEDKQQCVKFLDITMLAADMGITAIHAPRCREIPFAPLERHPGLRFSSL
jgi:hypothetical protein